MDKKRRAKRFISALRFNFCEVSKEVRVMHSGLKSVVPAVSQLAVVITFLFSFLTPPPATAQENTPAKRVERAASLIRDDRVAEAEQQLNYVLRVSPKDAAALNLLGTVRAKQNRLNEAEALFLRAVRIDNQMVGAHMNLARLYLLKGMPDKTALELKEVLRLEPGNPDASYRLAWLLLSQRRYDECISFVDKAKQSSAVSAPLLALLGDAHLRKGDLSKAEENYLLALGGQGDNADALLGLALISQAKGDDKATTDYLGRARDLIADSPDLLYKYAVVALNSQMYGEAMLTLKRAIELRPSEPSYYFVMGLTWLKKPDLQEAEQAFRQSLKIQPDNSSAQLHLGYALLKQKKFADAREWLEKSVQKNTGTPESFYYLGLIAQEQNEDARAVELFEKAIQLSPSFAHAHVALGAAYLKLKNYPRAQQALETGVKLNPDDSKGHYNLALLYARLKDQGRAQAEMQIVERLKSTKGQEKDSDLVTPSNPGIRRQ